MVDKSRIRSNHSSSNTLARIASAAGANDEYEQLGFNLFNRGFSRVHTVTSCYEHLSILDGQLTVRRSYMGRDRFCSAITSDAVSHRMKIQGRCIHAKECGPFWGPARHRPEPQI
jgi:hypothetical protein